jgi:hypothetical protein
MVYQFTTGWPKRLSDGAFVNPESDPEYLAWRELGNVPHPPAPEQVVEQARAAAKVARASAVSAITVTVGDKVFDGDETSQTRMARAIIGMQAAGAPTINWTLANNISAPVTVAELTEALILAGQAQAALWPIA